ncbi:MAG: helix-turn-helix transcriptional regulator [Armatimonadota bacterium]|nr:helix-turn-helix transcriptional regulator [Armatimonadota bacterium]
MRKQKRIEDAVEILDSRYGGDAEWDKMVAEEELNLRVAQLAYDLRTRAHLTQEELATRIGVTQPMISAIENADYKGSALEMLWRICMELGVRLNLGCTMKPTRVSRGPAQAAAGGRQQRVG